MRGQEAVILSLQAGPPHRRHPSAPGAPGLVAAIPTITEVALQLVSVGAAAHPPSMPGSHLLPARGAQVPLLHSQPVHPGGRDCLLWGQYWA